ncbi:MAG: GDSL-type esterase/lipase family protein [Planctomycetota bacterium]|nr:GDSL-type esterase/lipase family protein [Planctomycetota bacterium]
MKGGCLVRALCGVVLALPLAVGSTAWGTSYVWSGSSSALWNVPGNWGGVGVPNAASDSATLTGSANPAISLGGGAFTVGTLTFNTTGTTAFSVGTGTINLAAGGSIIKAATGSDNNSTVSAGVNLLGNAAFTCSATGGYWTRMLVLSGPVSGSGTVTVAGAADDSTVKISGNNSSFTGAVNLTKGQLIVSNNAALGSTGVATTLSGGTIWMDGGAASSVGETFIVDGNSQMETFGPGWGLTGTITVNSGKTWTVGNGGGNSGSINGVLGGSGNVTFSSGGEALGGAASNTLSGKVLCNNGSNTPAYQTLTLNKTGGATAIAGALELQNTAIVAWGQNNQVSDASPVTLGGGTLSLNGHSDTVGPLTVANGSAAIDMGGGSSAIRFAASNAQTWGTGEVLIKNWAGSGTDNVFVGSTASALTAGQLAHVGFVNPAGQAAGLYRATIGATGELTPAATAVTPSSPPWDMSASAISARSALYNVAGRNALSGAGTPLHAGEKITFFGDSITWQNGYVSYIQTALGSGAGTKNLGVQCINRGDNGGGVLQILNGEPGTTTGFGDTAPLAFSAAIAADHSDVAVVFIGINDVWWRGTSAATFQNALTQIVNLGHAANCKVVLATLTVHNELPDGTNPDDVKIEQFAQITRDVASSAGATLVDLRAAYIAYEKNNNYTLHLDGSLSYQSTGVLTYDGIHPTDTGNLLLADLISQGIYNATVPEPGSLLLLASGLGVLAAKRQARRARASATASTDASRAPTTPAL